ncbi:hypothetical protein [Qipengyuania sp. RANM35]|uniref:hypothetical protein n=1 Tax=Qipengyuania sp. RANM35 TaxID=3068635 RepID=UPI0034DADEC3
MLCSLVLAIRFRKNREAREKSHRPAVAAGDFTVRVTGWRRSELDRITEDFAQLYGIATPNVRETEAGVYHLEWSDGLNRDNLAFLVNFLHYPRGVDPAGRNIMATARLAPGVIDEVPPGRALLLYVPSDDEDFDRIHALDDQGSAYVVDFGRVRYVPTDDARCPPQVRGLIA